MSVRLDVERSPQLPASVYVPDAAELQRWADSACQQDGDVEASLKIVNSSESQQLNRDYRDKDRPTNVLSFPMELPAEVELALLGDLAVCAEIVAQEADEQNKQADAHWAHMIVHGMLHLQGYDHTADDEAQQMEALEIAILEKLGFDNPYLPDR